ncbi:MAG: DUF7282 domain-containing protein, partial [Halanaeroarchaeum sp.]
MTRHTDTFSRATVAVVAVLVVAAGMTAGAVMATPASSDDPAAVSGADQVQQVEDNETTTEEPADDETTEEPADDETTEEPADDETTEEPADEETTEEPADDETTEEPALTRTDTHITYTTPAGDAYGVENLTISETDEEEMWEVTAEITNHNDWLAVQNIELRADGEVVERMPVALEANESKNVSFMLDSSEWEDGDHTVSVLSHDYGEVLTVSADEPVEEPEANVTFEDQTSNGTTVVVDEVHLSEGGFVVIHESASLAEGDALGSTIGVSEYLTPGTHENVTVTLFDVPGQDFETTALENDTDLTAMPHLDTNDNMAFEFVTEEGAEDGPYTTDGEPVVDDAMITIESDEPEPTTEEPTNETTTEEEETPEDETTTEEEETPEEETTTEEEETTEDETVTEEENGTEEETTTEEEDGTEEETTTEEEDGTEEETTTEEEETTEDETVT